MRVRAAAGAASFRRRKTVVERLDEARQLVEALKREVSAAPEASRNRARSARERAAREREERLGEALASHDEIIAAQQAQAAKALPKSNKREPPDPGAAPPDDSDQTASEKKEKKPKEPRVSTTDPQARVIKMPDGGFRPAFNMQITSAAGTPIVVGVDVATNSSDRGLLKPAIAQVDARYGAMPGECLADGGFNKNDDIEWAAAHGVAVFCPPVNNKHATNPYAPRHDDGPGLEAWRRRMGSQQGQKHYKLRALTECVHAHMRHSGLYQVAVRGTDKVKAILRWHALAQNLS